MNPFPIDELLVKEYQRERMAEIREMNRFSRSAESRMTVIIYRALAKIGAVLENWGGRMQARYDHLASRKQCDIDMLAKAAK